MSTVKKDWKWNAPINKDGGLIGKSIEVYPVKDHPPYLETIDGRTVFTVPSIGAKTSNNTKYTRSEMSEMIDGTEARWMLKDKVEPLRAKGVTIESLPVGTKLVIGQIHGKNDELCRLYVENIDGKIIVYFAIDISYATGKEIRLLLKDANGIPLTLHEGEEFSYKITPSINKIYVSVDYKGVKYFASDRINKLWYSDTFYYKWGAYFNTLLKGAVAKVSFRSVK